MITTKTRETSVVVAHCTIVADLLLRWEETQAELEEEKHFRQIGKNAYASCLDEKRDAQAALKAKETERAALFQANAALVAELEAAQKKLELLGALERETGPEINRALQLFDTLRAELEDTARRESTARSRIVTGSVVSDVTREEELSAIKRFAQSLLDSVTTEAAKAEFAAKQAAGKAGA